MRFLPKRLFFSIALIVSLAAILVALAVLQYRWSGQISEVRRQDMRARLRTSVEQFSFQFNAEFRQLDAEFRQLNYSLQFNLTDPKIFNWNSYATSCDSLLRNTNRHLVRNIYLWVLSPDSGYQLLKLNRNAKTFEVAPWPSGFEPIRERYDRYFSNTAYQELDLRPFISNFSFRVPAIIQMLMAFQGNFQGSFQGAFQGRPGPPVSGGMPGVGMLWIGFQILELDREILSNDLFPDLVQRHFNGPDGLIYQVAVLGGRNHDKFIYKSDPDLTIESFDSADASMGLLEGRFGPMMQRPEWDFDPSGRGRDFDPSDRGRDFDLSGRGTGGPPGMQSFGGRGRRGFSSFFSDPSFGWELVVKHRVGSLEAAVAATRRRNLAFSFGSLLLLAVSTAFIFISAKRAQSLARLQIDFVAGVSHELRTPLAVICSAGDNLADGVIADTSHSTRKYGELIRNEGRKLAGMIEQILQYAGGQEGRRRYNLRPEPLNKIVDAALKQLQPAIAEAGFTIEKNFASDLPHVHVDATALSHVIQNLIQNSLKYSNQNRWLGIRTSTVFHKRKPGVLLTVEDKGIGIASAELPHIFDPFYRGNAAISAQIHGTGLGLYMVRETLISMGGTISVKSSPGKGSTFTITLPALPDSENSPAGEG
jgi:two-component system sensor histidine kinase SenX3